MLVFIILFLGEFRNKKNNGMQIYFCNDEKTIQYAVYLRQKKGGGGGGLLKC